MEMSMSGIDFKGTAPGLTPGAKSVSTLNIRCPNPKCDSMEATEIKLEAPEHVGQRVYRCVKCGHTKSLSVGGHLNI
jgi:hypothetical protein